MTESACSRLEHAKARMVRLEHRLQQARMRMSSSHASGTPQAKRDYADASRAASTYAGQLHAAIEKVISEASHCDEVGADAELLDEDVALAVIVGEMALGGHEVVPFSDSEDFLAGESSAAGFGADFVYRAHLDPLNQMLVEAGYDIMDVSPEARMEAQLRELEEAGFLGDFGAETSLPSSSRGLRRLRTRLRRQKSRIQRRIRSLPRVGRRRGRPGRIANDPITRDRERRLRRRLSRVNNRLSAVTVALKAKAAQRSARRGKSQARPRPTLPRMPIGNILTGPTAILPSIGYPTSTPTDIADVGITVPAIAWAGPWDMVKHGPMPTPEQVATIDPNHPEYQGLLNAPWSPDLARHHDYPDWVAVQLRAGRTVPRAAGGTRPYTPGGTRVSDLLAPSITPMGPGRPRIASPGRMAVPEVLEAPSKSEFMTILAGKSSPAAVMAFIREIRANIRTCKALSLRYNTRRNRDRARASQLRRRITRARRRSRSLDMRSGSQRTRQRQLARVIRRLAAQLNRVNQRVLDHTRLLGLAARAIPMYQSHLKRAQAKSALLKASKAIQESRPDVAAAHEEKKTALEHDADVKEKVADAAAKVTNTSIVAADNEALRDAAEGAQAELETKAESGASGAELAELATLVALLTEAINTQMPDLITSMSQISQMDLSPVFVAPVVPDPDVTGPTAILPVDPSMSPLTAPTDIADVGIPVPPLSSYELATGATRAYRVHPTGDPVGDAAQSYSDEREARLNAQLALLAEQGVDISGDTSFLDSHAPVGLWEDGAVDEFESGNVHMGADPWDQFGFNLTTSSGQPFNFSNLASGSGGGGTSGGGNAGAGTGAKAKGPSFSEVGAGIGGLMNGLGGILGNVLPWVTGNNNRPAPAPAQVSQNQVSTGNAVTQTPAPQVVYLPGNSPMATGQGGYSAEPEKNMTPYIVGGTIGLLGLGVFAWASTR